MIELVPELISKPVNGSGNIGKEVGFMKNPQTKKWLMRKHTYEIKRIT